MRDLIETLNRVSTRTIFPDGSACACISSAAIDEIASRLGCSRNRVTIIALEAGIVPDRYLRNLKSMTPAEQVTLLKSHACVVGLGGLGGGVIEILARLGIGHLTLIDGDRFEAHNLNRQFLSTPETIGQPKADVAHARVKRINSAITADIHRGFLNETNAPQLIADADVIIDCLDNLSSRFVLGRAARSAGIPLVSAAVAGDVGHVITIFPEDPGFPSVYGPEASAPDRGAETAFGCLPHAVTLLASLECSEAFKVLLDRGELLRCKMLILDLNDNNMTVLDLK